MFPLGLVLVVLAGSELFTGNNLMIIGVLNKQIPIYQLCLNWIIVYIGNFIGSIIITLIVIQSNLLSNQVLNGKIQAIYNLKLNYSFTQNIFLGIVCNLLVCLAIWVSCDSQTKADRIISLFLPIMAFVIIGGEHSVANMFFLTIGNWSNGLNIMDLSLLQNLIPVTIGNIIGGCFIGLVYYLINKLNTNII
jgi:formate/nitrite transporter